MAERISVIHVTPMRKKLAHECLKTRGFREALGHRQWA
jgi:hypothetical protein